MHKNMHRNGSLHEHLHRHLKELAGDIDLRGIELNKTIRHLVNCYDNAMNQHPEMAALSGPRLGILLRLMAEEDMGNSEGINPTRLSHFQGVGKTTISALLSGLEEQGYVVRDLDPQDKRAFRIRLTPSAREYIRATTPRRLEYMNQLASGLTSEEQDTLLALLSRLLVSISAAAGEPNN